MGKVASSSSSSVSTPEEANSFFLTHPDATCIQLSNPACIAMLKQHPQVVALQLNSIWEFSADDIRNLSKLNQLKTLSLYGCELVDDFFHALAQLNHLKDLSILDCDNVYDHDLTHLLNLKKLTSLRLERTDTTDEGIHVLSALKQLNSLALIYANDTEAVLESLKKFPALNELSLCGFKLTPAGIKNIAVCKNLTKLELTGAGEKISEASFKLLSALPLQDLCLSRFEFSDAALAYLEGLKNLKTLSLQLDFRNKISELKFLSHLTHLEHLTLNGVTYPDESGVEFLKELKNLKSLTLKFDWITDVMDKLNSPKK